MSVNESAMSQCSAVRFRYASSSRMPQRLAVKERSTVLISSRLPSPLSELTWPPLVTSVAMYDTIRSIAQFVLTLLVLPLHALDSVLLDHPIDIYRYDGNISIGTYPI